MPNNLCFATWNVNSIRARENQLKEVILKNKIDVLMLQETKVQDHHFPVELYESLGYNISFVGQKSYNGVAILSKIPFESYNLNLPLFKIETEDLEARYLEVSITFAGKLITFASVYVPNGQSELLKNEKLEESKRFVYKINFFKRLQERLKTSFNLKEEYLIFGGDYNVANEAIDLFNPKANEGGVGFHIYERNNLKEIISLGLKDAFRHFHPNKVAYSWWDYRTKAFDRD
jgi:exodeoxyribonuclease-3